MAKKSRAASIIEARIRTLDGMIAEAKHDYLKLCAAKAEMTETLTLLAKAPPVRKTLSGRKTAQRKPSETPIGDGVSTPSEVLTG